MRLGILYFLGGLGTILLFLTLAGGVSMQFGGSIPRGSRGMIDSVGGVLSALIWGLFSLGATNITEVVEGSGVILHYSSSGLLFVGVAMVGLSLLIALMGTTALVDVTDIAPGGAQ